MKALFYPTSDVLHGNHTVNKASYLSFFSIKIMKTSNVNIGHGSSLQVVCRQLWQQWQIFVSLVRLLDYYTRVIWFAVKKPSSDQMPIYDIQHY